jgi:hypothetical protein
MYIASRRRQRFNGEHRTEIAFESDVACISRITADGESNLSESFTVGTVDCLVKSHIFGRHVPHPLPPDLPRDAQTIALFSFSQFGRMARCGSYEDTTRIKVPTSAGEWQVFSGRIEV